MINKIYIIVFLALTLNAKHKHHESHYRDLFCAKVGGVTEYYLKDKTRVDCMTDTHVIEVDFANKFYEGIGQALHYSVVSGKKAGVYLIIENYKDYSYLDKLRRVAEKYDIEVFYDK